MFRGVFNVLVFSHLLMGSEAGEWSYENIKQWSRGNRYCAGNSQSPINLQFDTSIYDQRLRHIFLEDRHPQGPAELTNNGHSAQINYKSRFLLKHVAPESEDYKVEQVHFHWGHSNDNTNGSEHLYEGRSFPLEMHIVSYSNWYTNVHDALTNTRALAVVGVFFELSNEPNPALQPLVDALTHVRREGDRVNLTEEFNLKALIGEERMQRYYRYDGSLTTPPCYESVLWTVLVEPIKLAFYQLHAFRYLHDRQAKLMQNTYRPVQPLGKRKLFRSFHSTDQQEDVKMRAMSKGNSGETLTTNMKLVVILSSLFMILF